MYNSIQHIAITNRHLCSTDLLTQLERLFVYRKHTPHFLDHIILREKDLPAESYTALAKEVLALCKDYQVPCTLHTYYETALALHCNEIHLPFSLFTEVMPDKNLDLCHHFSTIGTSVHSLEDALLAEELGASYVTAGHIFTTSCKPGLPPRGLAFLQDIVDTLSIPVYAIGGIHASNMEQIVQSGAAGACMMSDFMQWHSF